MTIVDLSGQLHHPVDPEPKATAMNKEAVEELLGSFKTWKLGGRILDKVLHAELWFKTFATPQRLDYFIDGMLDPFRIEWHDRPSVHLIPGDGREHYGIFDTDTLVEKVEKMAKFVLSPKDHDKIHISSFAPGVLWKDSVRVTIYYLQGNWYILQIGQGPREKMYNMFEACTMSRFIHLEDGGLYNTEDEALRAIIRHIPPITAEAMAEINASTRG